VKTTEENDAIVKAAFGAENVARLLDEYFSARTRQSADLAWVDVYLLFLWTDPSTGLAHCYEGDASQPPQRWHERTLKFHAWLGASLEASQLTRKMGWLFRPARSDPAAQARGEDPELPSILTEALRRHYADHPSPEGGETLVERVQHYLELENNRRGLVDAGFADVLADIIRRVLGASKATVYTRSRPPRQGDEPSKVDLAIVDGSGKARSIVTAQWSLRPDRGEQLTSDHDDDLDASESERLSQHVLVTNEIDPARLKLACELQRRDHQVFSRIVHVNTYALLAAWVGTRDRSMLDVMRYIGELRLISLETWLSDLGG
jgi:hypothetical protein